MRVLFVCRANVGRSQMAMALYTLQRPGEAESAGTIVEEPGQVLRDRPGNDATFEAMREVGADISDNIRRPVTPELVSVVDRVIVLAERETWPEYLVDNPKVEAWEVQDPRGKDLATLRQIRDDLRDRVGDLIRRLTA
ncbi:MAG: low molecular weight phosphatase family protein [Patescibacteria group bacterium]|jgi:arsenate reductase